MVEIAGIVWALQKREAHPRRANFALIGLVISLLNGLASTALSAALPVLVAGGSLTATGMGGILTATSLVFSLIAAVALGLVVWAVFIDD